MLFEELPKIIRESTIMSQEDKRLLATIECIPTDMEIDRFRIDPSILELTNAFIGDESTRHIHLQEMAKQYLEEGNINTAWKVLLL